MIWNNHRIRLAALIASTGFAMFAMFFGSGNLVFPLLVGQLVGDHYGPAMIGFVVTGVAVPFLGLLGVLLYEGSYKKFLSIWGSSLGFILALFMLTLLGPLGVVPRCMTVSYGSFVVICDSVPAHYFNLVMAIVIYILCLNQNRIVTILGAFLAPLKIASVFIIIVYGVIYANQPANTSFSPLGACQEGIIKGYQTMDLLAAFFFASFMIRHIQQKTKQANLERYALKTSLYAMLVGAALLSFIYAGLVFLGATFADIFKSASPEMYLSVIADHTLGSSASVFVSITIILSCLTTAIALTTVFTEFIRDYVLKGRFSWQVCLASSILTAYAISILGFSSIATFLGPILSVLYPGLIVLTLSNLLLWVRRKKIQHKIQLEESKEPL